VSREGGSARRSRALDAIEVNAADEQASQCEIDVRHGEAPVALVAMIENVTMNRIIKQDRAYRLRLHRTLTTS